MNLKDKLVMVRGAGDLASGVIYVLKKAGFSVLALEIEKPSAIRRTVAYSEAVYEGEMCLEGYRAVYCESFNDAMHEMHQGNIAVLTDPACSVLRVAKPYALVDAVLAKKNLGTNKQMAPITVALGPGFRAGKDEAADVDFVIETMRGHRLGRIIEEGEALPNTGVPGLIAGHSSDRVLHAQCKGILYNKSAIGDFVEEGQTIAVIEDEAGKVHEVKASFSGLLRGLIRDGYPVTDGFKIADIDARASEQQNCHTISDKARALGGAVLCAILSKEGMEEAL